MTFVYIFSSSHARTMNNFKIDSIRLYGEVMNRPNITKINKEILE